MADQTDPFHCPAGAGGAINFIARAVGEVMQRADSYQIVVENRTGAGGTIWHGRGDEKCAGRLHLS